MTGTEMTSPEQFGFILRHAWLVPAIPLFSFVLVGLVLRPLSQKLAGIAGTLAVFAAWVCACLIAREYFLLFPPGGEHPAVVPWAFEWLRYQPGLAVNVGVIVDPISVLLMLVVTTVSTLVHVYSTGYMRGDPGYGRFFTYLNLFTFSMLGLVAAPNILQMYVCWELVGVSSFLLIGFYYQKPSAVAASKKAFIVTRFADLGFLIGVLILGYHGYTLFPGLSPAVAAETAGRCAMPLQPFDFLYLNSPEFLGAFGPVAGVFGLSLLTVALLLVFMGAAGKSAMFPLHIWLPDAMEGPTPVSALIHAATMVVAGVYLVARLFPAFAFSGGALLVVACVGAFTSLFAAVIGMTQDDIKRVLAFSTLSQLGYMMLALGVATMEHPLGHTAGMFHLFTHAFFKALLFLGAGAVIHAVHSNEIWDMGGLRRKMPVTHATFLIATLAISGFWPLSGFFSKDEILASALETGHYVIFGVALFVAGLTAFYMFRIYLVAFWGGHRSDGARHAHEVSPVMWAPLVVLAVLSVAAGYVPMSDFVGVGAGHAGHHGVNFAVAVPATLAALAGAGMALFLYTGSASRADAVVRLLGGVHATVKRKFYIDEIYLFVTHRIVFSLVSRPIAWFDRTIVDGAVNISAWSTRALGYVFGWMQTGQVQTYSGWYAGGALLVLLVLWAALI